MNKSIQKSFAKLLFVLVFTLHASANTYAQASFTIECPQKTIGKNDYLQIAFKIANAANVESINPPSFKNFSVVSGPNQESGMTSINGKVDQYISISYILKPNTIGSFTIAAASAKADGKDLKSNSINISVTNSSTSSGASNNIAGNSFAPFSNFNFDVTPQPSTQRYDDYILKKGENVSDKVKKNLIIKLDVSKTSCYVGEPIVASYKLYTRLRSESSVTNTPSFNGFSVSEMELNNNNSAGTEKYNGRDYNVYTLRKVQLYPLQAGAITLDPVVADNKISFIKSEYAGAQKGDMFFDMMQNFADANSPQDAVVEQHVSLQSKPVEIMVKPLPEENKPVDFKGSVGNFTIDASLQKDSITTDDDGNLKISITGSGNIQLVNAPKITWPEGIDGYEAKVKDGIDKSSVPMKGTKMFTYPFTVSKQGVYSIPAVSFSYFDPASATYKTIATQPLVVKVFKGKDSPHTFYANDKPVVEAPVTFSSVFEKYSLYFISGIIILAGLFLWMFKRNAAAKELIVTRVVKENNDQTGTVKTIQSCAVPENILAPAHTKLMEEKSGEFYSVLDTSIKKYLSAKLKVPTEELSRKRMNEELDKCNVGFGTSIKLLTLLDNIEMNLYAPPSNINHLNEVYENASEVVALLDKQMC